MCVVNGEIKLIVLQLKLVIAFRAVAILERAAEAGIFTAMLLEMSHQIIPRHVHDRYITSWEWTVWHVLGIVGVRELASTPVPLPTQRPGQLLLLLRQLLFDPVDLFLQLIVRGDILISIDLSLSQHLFAIILFLVSGIDRYLAGGESSNRVLSELRAALQI